MQCTPNELPGPRFRESLLGHMFCLIIAYTVDHGTNLMSIPRAALGLMHFLSDVLYLLDVVVSSTSPNVSSTHHWGSKNTPRDSDYNTYI